MTGVLKEDFTDEAAFERGFWRMKRILVGKIGKQGMPCWRNNIGRDKLLEGYVEYGKLVWIKMFGVQSYVVSDKAKKANMESYVGGKREGEEEWYS